MAILGKKFNPIKSENRLGKKVDGTINKLGKKADGIINKAKNINDKVLQKVQGANNMIINKSGNVLDKTSGVLNKIAKVTSVADAVLGSVPIVGNVTNALNSGVQGARAGINRLDDARDKYAKTPTKALDKYERKSDKAFNKAGKVTGKLEKFNTRKAIEQMSKEENNDSFS